jgi:hypothetical protein
LSAVDLLHLQAQQREGLEDTIEDELLCGNLLLEGISMLDCIGSLKAEVDLHLRRVPKFASGTIVEATIINSMAGHLQLSGVEPKCLGQLCMELILLGIGELGNVSTEIHVQQASILAWASFSLGRESEPSNI